MFALKYIKNALGRNRIEREFKDIQEHSEFRIDRSCVNSIFTLKQTVEKRVGLLGTWKL